MNKQHTLDELKQQFLRLKNQQLNLDLTRGKPCSEQLDLSNRLDGILAGNYQHNGIDSRNYGGLDGLIELKTLFSKVLNTDPSAVVIGGNSSLTLMHQTLMFAHFLGLFPNQQPWFKQQQRAKFICPVPGYDRHFNLCKSLGIDMLTVDMLPTGPDMDQVEALVKSDHSIKGIWNVPRFSNPTGITYSDETVKRIAELPTIAASDFLVMWDNAYALHSFDEDAPSLAPISQLAANAGTLDHIVEFASTSKITFAGSGIAAIASGENTLNIFKQHLSFSTIGPDKVNQLRHLKLFPSFAELEQHMRLHAAIIKPRFDAVLDALDNKLGAGFGTWTRPAGGYFIAFDTLPGLAEKVIALCAEAGVKMTPAGATFPYGEDPDNKNIRIAPSFATLDEINIAMDVFVVCVKLATQQQQNN